MNNHHDVLPYTPRQHYLSELTPSEAEPLTLAPHEPEHRYYAIITKPTSAIDRDHTARAIAIITIKNGTITHLDYPTPWHDAISITNRLSACAPPTTPEQIITALDPFIDPHGAGAHTA